MVRRFGMLAVALFGIVACSGGGGSSPNPSQTSQGASKASLSVALGNEQALSSGDSYELEVTLTNSSGQVIGGTYSTPVTLTTSDTTDTGFSPTAAGENISQSVTITSSTQPVFFVYDGAKLTSPVTLTAAAANVQSAAYTFAASGSGSSPTTTTSSTISSVSIAPNGALPQAGVAGSFTVTVAGYSSSGSIVTGTYTNPVVLTSNDTKDLTFSVNGSTPSTSATVSASGAIVVVDYDGATVPATTTISAAASGAPTVTIPFSPTAAGSSAAIAITSLSLAQIGATPNQGTMGQFALTVTALASGQPISGQYPSSVVVTTNDSTDLMLSTTSGGPFTPSVTISNSSTIVYVQYTGAAVPQSTEFAANAGSVQGVLPFDPAIKSQQALYVASLYISTSGAPPDTAADGSQPIYINAYDQNGNIFSGTYPSAVNVTLNNSTELDLSLGSYVAAMDCNTDPAPNPCPNVAAQVVNNSGQVVFGNYAVQYNNFPSQVSISTTGIQCAAINFPLAIGSSTNQNPAPAPAQTGSTPYSCQILNPAPTPSPDAAATTAARHRGHWQLVPVGRR